MGGSKSKDPKVDMLPQFRQAGYTLGGTVNSALKNRRLTPYGGDWVADMTGGQKDVIGAITERGLGGSPLLGATGDFVTDTLGGKYLNQGNPYVASAMDAGMQQVNRQLASQFGGSGMSGSPAHLQFASEAYSNAAAPLYMQNYQQERALQAQAAGLAPQINQQEMAGLAQALGAQGMYQDQAQREIDALRERYDLQKNEPFRRAQMAAGALGGGMGPAGSYGGSPGSAGGLAGGLSGAASGAMIGMATKNPWVALGGGILGGLGGGLANK